MDFLWDSAMDSLRIGAKVTFMLFKGLFKVIVAIRDSRGA